MHKASLVFFGPSDGGRFSPPTSGYRPACEIDGTRTSCIIESVGPNETFSFGISHVVLVRLMFPEHFPNAFVAGRKFSLFEGEKRVGTLEILQ